MLQIRQFCKVIRDEEVLLVSGREGLNALKFIWPSSNPSKQRTHRPGIETNQTHSLGDYMTRYILSVTPEKWSLSLPGKKHPRITSFHIDNADANMLSEHYARTLSRVVIEPLARQKRITVEKHHYKVGSCGIWTGAFHSGMQVKLLDPSNAYVIYLPIAGELDIDVGSKRFSCGPEHAFIGDFSAIERLQLHEGRRHMGIAFGHEVVVRQLSELLDAPVNKKLEFSTILDCRSPTAGKILAASTLLWTSLANEPEHIASAKFAELMFQSLAVLLLESVPHSYSAALTRPVAPAIPRHVKRAIDFMIANVSMPITIADVARESGSSLRSLHLGFQQYKGTSPLHYLRQIRLECVRRALIGDIDQSAISEIAQEWGFTHMGRFATLYKQAFGQTPSETVQSRGTSCRNI